MKHVIIGAGVAGVAAARAIKELDRDAEVVLVGAEDFLPYKRYLLTEFLCGSVKRDELFYTPLDALKEMGIQLRKGQFVKAIRPGQKSVKLHHNEVVHYDKLLVATGGTPGLGPVLRRCEKHIQRYYSLQDILVLKQRLAEIQECIVFGGGLSALDLLCGLRNLNKRVTYIVPGSKADFPLVASEFADQLHDFLEQKGVAVITNDRIAAVERLDGRYRVLTLDQKELTADMVFAWDYYKPNIAIIAGTEIEKKLGILVNTRMETTVADIYAAGDCVEIYHPGIKDYWINFGWSNAEEQGKVAGQNMVGQRQEYRIHETLVFNLKGKSLEARWWE